MYNLWLFCAIMAELSSCQSMARKIKKCHLAHYRRTLTTPSLDERALKIT